MSEDPRRPEAPEHDPDAPDEPGSAPDVKEHSEVDDKLPEDQKAFQPDSG